MELQAWQRLEEFTAVARASPRRRGDPRQVMEPPRATPPPGRAVGGVQAWEQHDTWTPPIPTEPRHWAKLLAGLWGMGAALSS